MKTLGYSILASCALAMVISLFSVGSQAQTHRRKQKPLATPTPDTRELTGAEIISQGGVEDEPIMVPVEKTPVKPAPSTNAAKIRELNERIKKLESGRGGSYDEQQKRLLMNLDIITRAEARTESLRKQVFEMVEKENTISARLDQIEYEIRPEVIERILQNGGSLRPEEIRDSRRKVLESERSNLQSLLTSVQSNRTNLEANLQRAEQMVEKLRAKLEKDIDNSLVDEQPQE